jgi:hypothetical protein
MVGMTLTIPSSTFLIEAGQDVDLFPAPSELTVAQAAKFLDGSVGLINELLDGGLITFRWENDERLVQWNSLWKYAEDEKRRIAAMSELFQMFREAGLSDDYD